MIRLRLLGFMTAILAAGCMVRRPSLDETPIVEAAAQFAAQGGADADQMVDPWWQAFGDPTLDALIQEALSSNLDLRQFAARIEQADARLRQAGGRLLPTVDGFADYSSEWTDSSGSGDGTDHSETLSVGVALDWELDVWGRLRSAREAAGLDAQATREDWLGARVLLSALVAETYFQILESRLERELLEEQTEINNTLLDLTELRFGQGQSSIVDVLQQREQLASTQALIPLTEARVEHLEYVLDVLLGRAPGHRERLELRKLPAPPELPDVGIPLYLLEGRPDLAAARSRLEAIDYRISEAVADRFPRINIGGALSGTGTPRIDTLIVSALAGAVAPIFDGGVRRAEVDFQEAQWHELLAFYSQSYLRAVQEVETAMVSVRKQAERVGLLENQLVIAQALLRESRNRYSQGLTDYLPVLAAVVTVQELERQLLTSRREELSFRVALHRALGGPMAPVGVSVGDSASANERNQT